MRKAIIILASLFFSFSGLLAQVETGTAVYYADALHGQRTAFGEIYRMDGFSAAHKTYPLGTLIRVTNTKNNRSVNVRVNDRIAANSRDIASLSKAAARQIDLVGMGRAKVQVERVGYSPANPNAAADSYASAPPSSYNYYGGTPNPYENISPSITPKGYGIPQSNAELRANNYLLSPTTFGYGIQLASFKKVENAVEHIEKLIGGGFQNVYIWQKDGNNRVVVASFPDKLSAGRYLDMLKARYQMKGILVKLN